VHGFPYASTSLGLINQRSPDLGVIYNPLRPSLFRRARPRRFPAHSVECLPRTLDMHWLVSRSHSLSFCGVHR